MFIQFTTVNIIKTDGFACGTQSEIQMQRSLRSGFVSPQHEETFSRNRSAFRIICWNSAAEWIRRIIGEVHAANVDWGIPCVVKLDPVVKFFDNAIRIRATT